MRLDIAPSTNPSDYGFCCRIRPRFAETDAMGIIHHANYLLYFEQGRVEYLRSVGFPYTAIRDDGIDFAVIEAFVSYRRPLQFDDPVDLYVATAAATRTSLQMAYLATVEGEVRASGITVHGVVDSETGRPRRLPDWVHRLVTPAAGSIPSP